MNDKWKHDILFPEMNTSTEAQKILEIIKDFLQREGRPPTIREISSQGGFSSKLVLHYLFELEASGYIKRSPYRSRTIQLVSRDEEVERNVSMIPLIGASAAGPVLLAEQNIEEYIPVSTKLIGSHKDTFLLKVRGSSMKPYLENGDIAIVKPQDIANKGDIIVASIENDFTHEFESTLKEYYPMDGNIILKPINDEFDPILVKEENLHIQGIVKGVIKYLD